MFFRFLDFAALLHAPKKASLKLLASGMDLMSRRSRRSMGSAQRVLQPMLQVFAVIVATILYFSSSVFLSPVHFKSLAFENIGIMKMK